MEKKLEEIKKSISEILDIMDDAKDAMDAAYKDVATFFTSLKEKDISQAYYQMIILKRNIDSVLEKLDRTVDNYESKVIELLKEEEND